MPCKTVCLETISVILLLLRNIYINNSGLENPARLESATNWLQAKPGNNKPVRLKKICHFFCLFGTPRRKTGLRIRKKYALSNF